MSKRSAVDIDPREHRVLADGSRVAVLTTLRHSDRPLAIPEIADEVGLHPNTVRAHLAHLTRRGYASVRSEDRERRPGRPRLLYAATAKCDDAGGKDYRILAEALIAFIAEQGAEGGKAAVAAGRLYGEQAARQERPFEDLDTATATREIVKFLTDAGFQPRASRDGSHIDLHRCPFQELVEVNPEVVCGVHLGLLQGALAELGAPIEATGLQPFVRPGLCVATLRRRESVPG